jgi:hypothetical protein
MRATRLLALAVLAPLPATPAPILFDNCVPGTLPSGWTITMTHGGAPPLWHIVSDSPSAKSGCSLAQVSRDPTAGRFPLAIWNGLSISDGDISVAFKAVSGNVDRAAGVVWRYQDPNNYYVARANALENNVVLYKVENGVRLSIAPKGLPSRSYGVKRAIPSGRWNTLRVVFQGRLFIILLNSERLFEGEDQTFVKPGKTGLWTKADSVTYFSDFEVRESR